MKLDKAIEIQKEILNRGSMIDDQDDSDAIKLGNEALKRIQNDRELYSYMEPQLLPSETED